MEKKRRARINVSLEQLKSLLERNYSQNVSIGPSTNLSYDDHLTLLSSFIGDNSVIMSFIPFPDQKTQTGESRHTGANSEIFEDPSEFSTR